MVDRVVNMRGRGLRGENFSDVARRTGGYGVAPSDTDQIVLKKFADDIIQKNPNFKGDKGDTGEMGGNVMSVGLRIAVDNSTIVPNGVGVIQFSGFRKNGQGAHQMFLWDATMPALDPAGQGYWWITTNGGAKSWFIQPDQGSPEMLGAYADDGVYAYTNASHGTDDWIYIQKAVNYFSKITPNGKYWSSKSIKLLRCVNIEGPAGTEAGFYPGRLRFTRGCVPFFPHRSNTNSDDTGKIPSLDNRAADAGADGFRIANLEIICGQGDRIAYDGSNLTEHAIWPKCRGIMENLRIRGPMGHGIYENNTATSTDPYLRGNSNGSTIRNVRVENCTGSPVLRKGADANAGRTDGVNGSQCGGPVIDDSAFLGNVNSSPQASNAGRDGLVYYGGFRYWCVNPDLASTEVPGTGSAWYKGAASANADSWVSGKPYLRGASYYAGSNSGRAVWINPYTEGNSGPFMVSSDTANTVCWVISGLLNGDGKIIGPYAWLADTGLRINTRDGVNAAFLGATFGYSGIGAQGIIHNTGAIGTTRGSSYQINVGYEADGTTPHVVARYAARSGATATTIGEAQIDLWNPGTSTWDSKLLFQSAAVSPNGTTATIDSGRQTNRWNNTFSQYFRPGVTSNGPIWTSGTGSPEGVLTARIGSLYTREDGGAGTTLYVKESGTGNTGWIAK